MTDKSGTVRIEDRSAYGCITSDEHSPQVRAVTVDEMVDELSIPRVDFMKIDVEGFEWSVLKGANRTLAKFNPLVHLEFNSWCMTAFAKVSTIEFAEWLLDNFSYVYAIHRSEREPLMLGRIDRGNAIAFAHDNMVRHGCIDDLVVTSDPHRLT